MKTEFKDLFSFKSYRCFCKVNIFKMSEKSADISKTLFSKSPEYNRVDKEIAVIFFQDFTIQLVVNLHRMTFNFYNILQPVKQCLKKKNFWWLLQIQRKQKLIKACLNG